MQALIDRVLNELREEQSALEQRLHLVRNGIVAMERLGEVYGSAASEQLASAPVDIAVATATTPVVAKPRAAVVPAAESAIAYVADAAVESAAAETGAEPVQAQPVVATAPVAVTRAEPSEDVVAQLQNDINNWWPQLKREKLEDVYLMLLLRKDRFSKNLPPTMDLKNPQVVRTLTNHLRHEAVPGYFQLCARLKQHEHLGYLYRRARDKATGSIFRAYPELFTAASEVAPAETEGFSPVPAGYTPDTMAPTGAHHFAALAQLRTPAPQEQAAA
jgi:hypothetical protein